MNGRMIRPMMQHVAEKTNGEPLVGVEIGVRHGFYSECILKNMNIKKLYGVDPYDFYVDSGDRPWNRRFHFLNKALRVAKNRLKSYIDSGRYELILKTSSEASELFPDEFFDFSYIDGCHLFCSKYGGVLEDILVWYPKVKVGGVIGGHDFNIMHLGVIEAVLGFMDMYHLEGNLNLGNPEEQMTAEGDEGKMCDWWFDKEKIK